jgi:hypothetical protein
MWVNMSPSATNSRFAGGALRTPERGVSEKNQSPARSRVNLFVARPPAFMPSISYQAAAQMKNLLTRLPGRLTLAATLATLVLTAPQVRATNDWVLALSGNGVLSWTNPPEATGYKVFWAPTVEGPWSADWDAFKHLAATGAVMQVPVPMFYRVGLDNATNTLLIHVDGPDSSTNITDVSGHAISP